MKRVTVVVSGVADNNVRDIELASGTTVRDVLEQLGLGNDYRLKVQGSNTVLAEEEPIYPKVPEGGKIFAVTDADVGT